MLQSLGILAMCTGCSRTEEASAMPDQRVVTIVQSVIDSPKLDRYYHADSMPGRKPLLIVLQGAQPPAAAQIKKFGQAVSFIASDDRTKPVLTIAIKPPAAGQTKVEFSYAVEGIAGTALFDESGTSPRLLELTVVER